MKKRVLAVLLSTVMVTSSTSAVYAADLDEEFLDIEESEVFEEELLDMEEEASNYEEVSEDVDASEEGIDLSVEPADEAEAPLLTSHATGYVPGPQIEIQSGGEESEASFQETYPEKYINYNVPTLKDQGNYETCWAHSAIGILEINLMKTGLIKDPDLSELHLASFYYHTVNDPLGGLQGDYLMTPSIYESLYLGGYAQRGLDIIGNWTGAASEELVSYDYAPLLQSFGLDDSLAYDDVVHVRNAYIVPTNHKKLLEEKDTGLLNPMKKAIHTYGATTIAYRALSESATVTSGKVYNKEYGAYYSPEKGEANHEVIVVGWDDTFPKENFAITPPGDGAFLIKNSWTTEGSPEKPDYSGYFWMSYYEGTLEEQVYAAEAVLADDYDNNYEYDAFLFDNPLSVNKGANVFTAHAKGADEGEELKAVSVYLTAEDCKYTVDVYTDLKEPSDPESGIKASTETAITSYAGRYTVPLTTSVKLKAGETFSVVVSCEKEDLRAIAADPSTKGEKSVFEKRATLSVSAHEGESFSYVTGEWVPMNDNLKIKAFTDNIISEPAVPESIAFTNVPEKGLELGIDQTLKLKYSISPIAAGDSAVTWESSNPEIAMVENGFVTGVSEGTATIKVITENGKEAGFTVNVIKKLKSVKMEVGTPYYNKGLYQRQCYFTLDPEGYEPKQVNWYSEDDSVLTIDDNGILTYVGLGVASGYVVVDGISDSKSFWGRYRDDEVYHEVKSDNSVLIKWTPKENVGRVNILVGDDAIASFDAKDNVNEYLDKYYVDHPVTETTTITYTLTFEVGAEAIPLSFDVELKPLGTAPAEEKIQDWGDVTEDEIKAQFEDDPANIPENVWYVIKDKVYTKAAAIEDLTATYSGSAITLDDQVAVFCGNNRLVKDRDYTISHKDNINPSTTTKATMTIAGKGNFASSASFTFSIAPAEMTKTEVASEDFIAVDIAKKTKLSSIKPVIKFAGKKLKEGKDYTLSYYDVNEKEEETLIQDPSRIILSTAGAKYNIYAEGKENGNFIGKCYAAAICGYNLEGHVLAEKFTVGNAKGKTVEIAYEDIPSGDISVEALLELLFDNRDGKTPKGYVKYKGKELVYDTDYDLHSLDEDPGSVGEHTFYVTGKSEKYIGIKKCTYKVTGFDISKSKVAGLLTSVEYNSNKLELYDFFDKKDKKLEKGWDDVTLYKQTKTGKVKLTEMDEEGKGDYAVFYDYIKDAGKYTLTFVGINGCTGAIKKTVTVKPYDIKKDPYKAFSAHATSAKYSKSGAILEVTVTVGGPEGLVLTEGVDYTLSYKNNKKIATRTSKSAPTVMVKGVGNFKGTVKGDTFTIFKGDANDLYLSAPAVHFNAGGKDGYFMVTPKVMDGTAEVSFGDKKDIQAVKKTDFQYYYSEDATMTDGSKKDAGSLVLKTDRPKAGTTILVVCPVKTGAKNKYSASEGDIIGGTYSIVDADKDISICSVALAQGKKLSVYYSSIKAEDLVVTLKGSAKALTPGTDYVIDTVITDKSKKTITLVIRGIGAYGGTRTVTLKVVEGL